MKITFSYLLLISSFCNAQQTLKLEEIMAGNDFIGHQPNYATWSPDNQTIYFNCQKNGEDNIYSYNSKSKKTNQLEKTKLFHLPTNGTKSSLGNSAYYFQKLDRIYLFSKNESKLIYQSATPFSLHKVIDEEIIIIRQKRSFYSFDHKSGVFRQCINFSSEEQKNEKTRNYLQKQQTELFQFIRDENIEQSKKQINDSITSLTQVPKFNLKNKDLGLYEVNNSLTFCLFRTDEYTANKYTEIESNITSSGYSQRIKARPKVGSENPSHEIYWMDLQQKTHGEIDLSELPGILKSPIYLQLYNKGISLTLKEPKRTICTQMLINNSGSEVLLELKSYDNKDRWIALFNVKNKTLICVDHQHDEAWIGGPGISGWNMVPGTIGWLKGEEKIYFQSEKTGYSHLYIYDLLTKKTSALTEGKYEIHKAQLSQNGQTFYITSNKSKPGNRSFYHLNIKSKKWTTILGKDGNFEVKISPNEDQLAIRYSYQNKPWEIFISANTENAKMTQITDSQNPKFKKYSWRTPEIISFKNQDNKTVYARLFKPEASKNNGAAIQFVHGAGYLQNAHNWWSGYYREYMFHNLLCDQGYTIIDIDYSASKGYGRDFRTSIYRHMGGQDLDDQIAGRDYLIKHHNIDPNKVGIYGGSYGGFITIMALLKYPGYFQCGAAIRSVTDWAHYNHAYTSNILNTPETDSIAFRRSSPIYYAENLQDDLLILHGMMDNNVQFQDVVRLNQRFIELGKKTFTMALYPVEPHGFVKTSSWVDEYSRILNLFEKNLR